MYFYKDIHLSLNRCVKKTANTEARCCHVLQEESLPLCLFASNFLLSVFKLPSARFTQAVEIFCFSVWHFWWIHVFVGLCPVAGRGQCKRFMKLVFWRYQICSSDAEDSPASLYTPIPPATDASSIRIYQQKSWRLEKSGLLCLLQGILRSSQCVNLLV